MGGEPLEDALVHGWDMHNGELALCLCLMRTVNPCNVILRPTMVCARRCCCLRVSRVTCAATIVSMQRRRALTPNHDCLAVL